MKVKEPPRIFCGGSVFKRDKPSKVQGSLLPAGRDPKVVVGVVVPIVVDEGTHGVEVADVDTETARVETGCSNVTLSKSRIPRTSK